MKNLSRFLFSLLVIGVLSACTTSSTPEPVTIKAGLAFWPGYYPLFVAQGQALFTAHGLQVNHKIYGDIGEVVTGLQTQQLDVGFITISDALTLDSRNPGAFKAVVGTDYSNGSDVVMAHAEIKTISDLRGKRIGLSKGTFGELFVRKMLESQNMSLDDVIVVNTNASEIPEAIPALIDAGQTFEPYVSQGKAKGQHILFSSTETPGLIPGVIVFRQEFMAQHPAAVREFIQVWFTALAFWQANPTAGNEMIAQATGLPVAEISLEGVKLLNLEDNLKAFTPGTDTLSLYGSGQINRDFLLEAGVVNSVPEINRILDASFLTPSTTP